MAFSTRLKWQRGYNDTMPSEHATPPKAKRRWGQFGLRTLFALMTLVAIFAGLFAARLERARRQAAAVIRLREIAGGTVKYGFHRQLSYYIDDSNEIVIPYGTGSTISLLDNAGARPLFLPQWLVSQLGVDYFGDVIEVATWNYIGSDEDLADLKFFPRLRRIDFIGAPRVTDEGLVHLTKLRHLEYVRVGGSRITDEGLARLRESLPNCQVER